MKVEVRAVGLKAMRRKRGLTQRQLGNDLGLSLHYIPAIGGKRSARWPRSPGSPGEVFGCRFEDLFEVVLADSGREPPGAGAPVEREVHRPRVTLEPPGGGGR